MDLDALLRHYLAADDPAQAGEEAVAIALRRLEIDLGVEQDAGRRFALWSLMAVLGDAPDPRAAFKDRETQVAADRFARLLRRGRTDDDTAG